MAGNIVTDIYADFEGSLSGFYALAANGLTAYVIPIAWVLLGICMLVWCILIIQGKVTSPLTDWFLKFVGFMIVMYAMSGGYLSLVASPLFNLNSQLVTAMSNSVSSAPDLLGQVNEKAVDLVSAMFTASVNLFMEAAIGPSIGMFGLAIVVLVVIYGLLGIALFSIIYGKLGLTMVLALGPFFILMLILQQTRSYFFAWLNTALYFVFYQVVSALFIFLFIGVLQGYTDRLISKLSNGAGPSLSTMVLNLVGAGPAPINYIGYVVPLIMICIAMIFMFLQLSTIVGSMTSGSGGMMGGGLSGVVHLMRMSGKK